MPEYYERDEKGLPARWVELMRRSMASTIWQFSTTRMLHEYIEQLYLPAAGVEVNRRPTPRQERQPVGAAQRRPEQDAEVSQG